MKLGLRLLLFMLLVTTALAASKCGEKSHKSKYGKQASFRSVAGMKSKCRYRIRSLPGFHIKLVLENYHPDPCCLKVSISPKQKARGKKAQAVEIPSGPRATLVVNASDIIVSIITSSAEAQAVVINHEAVIPTGGNFGYNFRATRKPKVLRSPNFPKINLPSGVRSVWNVTSGSGEVIRIDVMALSTSDDQDTLEIFDGPDSVGILSGRKKYGELPITKYASSGNMVIILETQTATSKGFKAKIVAAEKDGGHSIEPAISGESNETLQCHKRLRILSSGTTVSDENSLIDCTDGEICGMMIVEGSTTVSGLSLPIRSETLHCIPRSLCGRGCGKLSRRDNSIRVDSCNLTCCSTNLCNSLSDGPPTSSALPPVWPLPGRTGGIRCNEQSEVTRASGMGLGSASSGNICPSNSVCALYVFSGLSNDPNQEKVVGFVAKCTPEANCSEDGCSALSETRDVNLGSCNVTCCREDNCNDPQQVTRPTLPPPEPVARSCYDIRRLHLGNVTQTDIRLHSTCSDQEDRCLRVDAYVTNREGQNGVASFGKCISQLSCSNLDCVSVLGLEDPNSATSCVARCCSNDLCNETPLTIPEPTGTTTGLWCHQKSVTVRERAVSQSSDQNTLCDDGDVCAVFKFYGTSTESHQIGEPMAGYAAMCRPVATCNEDACRTLSEVGDIVVTSCEATCCSTSMCNDPGEPPMPSPRPPRPGYANRCYNIQQTSLASGIYVINVKSEAPCESDSVCIRTEATVTTSGMDDVTVVYGSCGPKILCGLAICDTLTEALQGQETVRDCNVQCCETDLCNGEPISDEESTFQPTAVSPPVTALLSGYVSQCYSISQTNMTGSSLLNQKSVRYCDPESVCVRFESTIRTPGFDDTIAVTYGACLPKVACCSVTTYCDLVTRSIPSVTVEQCRAQCCETELCNENPLPETTTPASPPTLSIAASISSASAGYVSQCYSIFQSNMSGSSLLNQKSVRHCDPDSVCLRVEVSTRTPGFDETNAVTYGTCYPKIACCAVTTNCDLVIRSIPGVTVEQCRAQCCETELCNENPLPETTTPATLPTLSIAASITSAFAGATTGLWCHRKSVTVQEGAVSQSPDQNTLCDDGDVCAVFKFYGTSTESHQIGEPMAGYAAMCRPAATCNEDACRTLSEAGGIAVTSCEATCCSTSMCNDPGEPPMSSPRPPRPGYANRCYNIEQTLLASGIYLTNVKSEAPCDPDSVCIRTQATVTTSGIDATIVDGSCVLKILCGLVTCDALTEGLSGQVTTRDCNIQCCETDLCNGEPISGEATTSPPTAVSPSVAASLTGSVSQCYSTAQVSVIGISLLNEKSVRNCGPGSVCVRLEGSARKPGFSNRIELTFGDCFPEAMCCSATTTYCDLVFRSTPGLTVEQCRAKCCETELCNENPLPETTTPATLPTLSIGASISSESEGYVSQCYRLSQGNVDGISLLNKKSVQTCGPRSVCFRLESSTRRPGVDDAIVFTYGACLPKAACCSVATNCDLMTRSTPGVTVEQCRAECCETELCNENPLPQTTTPTTPPTLSIAASISSASAGRGGVPETTKCYYIFEVKSYGITLPGAKRDIMPCLPGSQCVKILTVSSDPSYSGITVKATIGYCLMREVCASMDCSTLPQIPGMTESTCTTECCDGDLCNG